MNIAVIGDVMLDKYNDVVVRNNPENTAPAYTIEDVSFKLGGAANAALMLQQFGAKVKLLGCVGADDNAKIIKNILEAHEIPNVLLQSITPTILKERFISDKYLFRVDFDFGYDLIETDERILINAIERDKFDAIVVSDYAKGTLTKNFVEKLKALKIPMFVDTKPKNIEWYSGVAMIKPNRKEFLEIAKSYNYNNEIESNNAPELFKSAVCDISSKLGSLLLITLGSEGLIYSDGRNFGEVPGIKVNCVDVTGAGDVTMAAFVAKYLETKKLDVAANFANEMAAKSVTQKQTGLCL